MTDSFPRAFSKRPKQKCSIELFEKILAESEKLLAESGLSGFSIPAVAKRLDSPRSNIYLYFPTHYAVLNELAAGYILELERALKKKLHTMPPCEWSEAGTHVMRTIADFYNHQPVAQLLLLGNAVTDTSYQAQEMCIKRMSEMAKGLFSRVGIVPPEEPDVIMLTVDVGVACLRRSLIEHGCITPEYCEMASDAMTRFLRPHLISQP